MEGCLKTVKASVSPQDGNALQIDIFILESGVKTGRYQVRTNADGRRDVYYSDIRSGAFDKRRKLQRATGVSQHEDPAIAAIIEDLARRGLEAPELATPFFRS